jgi:hypothetical protein
MLDAGEEGIADISIKVGKETAMTNEYGYYQVTVRAKSVDVGVEINSIPDGFIFSTPTIRKVEIIPHKMQIVDFGINAESGIYGIVYYDRNGNGKPDSDDEFAGKVKMTLDGKQVSTTDFEGNYFFGVVDPGKHQIQIDVNTLPAGYLPKIRIKNEIEVSEGSTYVFHIPLDQVKPKDK